MARLGALLWWCSSLVLALVPAVSASAEDRSLEYAVEATFLYKFAPFVTWPQAALPETDSPFTICLLGDDPIFGVVETVTRGQHDSAHPIVIRRLQPNEDNTVCQEMFVGGPDDRLVDRMLSAAAGKPILTVTDLDRNPGAHGIIGFVIVNNHVRFDIDDAAAERRGLTISSKLLDLARNVRQGDRR